MVKDSQQKINKDPNPDKEEEKKIVREKKIDKEIGIELDKDKDKEIEIEIGIDIERDLKTEKDNDKEVVNVHVRLKNHHQAEIYSVIKVVDVPVHHNVVVNVSNKDSKKFINKNRRFRFDSPPKSD